MSDPTVAAPAPSLPEWLGLRVLGQEDTQATVQLTPRPEALNYRGEVHGGTLATVADVSMALAASGGLSGGVVPVTAGLELHYLRPGSGTLVAVASVVASTARRRIAQVVITDSSDHQVLVATGAFALASDAGIPPPMPAETSPGRTNEK